MKNSFLKLCSLILVTVLLANMLPVSALAEEFRETVANTETREEALQSVTVEDAYVVDEVEENRTEYTKEFLMSNGLHMATVYSNAVHYQTEGRWEEINNTLVTEGDGVLSNTAGVWDVNFPQQLTNTSSISVVKDGFALSFSPQGELTQGAGTVSTTRSSRNTVDMAINGTTQRFGVNTMVSSAAQVQEMQLQNTENVAAVPSGNHSQLQYSHVYQDTHMVYDLDGNTVKESVILERYRSELQGYQYQLNAPDMIPVLQADNSIYFYDKTQSQIVMVMPAPFLIDDNGEYNQDVQVQLTGSNGNYILTYILPQQWLSASDRAWPVVLDPVVEAKPSIDNVIDRTVTEHKTYSRDWGMNSCGYDTDTGKQRFYLMYNELPALTSSDVIVDASVHMYKYTPSSTVTTVEVRKVNSTWNSESITWSNKPQPGDFIEDYAVVDNVDWYSWSVTDIVKEWYTTGVNTGMMFKASDAIENSGTPSYKQFWSSDYGINESRPILTIYFRNNNGLESYWDYTGVSGGQAGSGYINNYTGNLTWVRTDMGFDGNLMPVSINHVYNMNEVEIPNDSNNSNDTGENYFGVGNGWRTNYHQRVYKWSLDDEYYIWEDSDGTDHYFYRMDNETHKYEDEDGLELTLTDSGSGNRTYCIADKKGNCSYFDSTGRLTAIENNQQTKSTVTVEYLADAPSKIAKITDGAGREYTFTYENGLLRYLDYMWDDTAGKSEYCITFAYESSKLTSVIYPDATRCYYSYDSNWMLTSVEDVDGYRLQFSNSAPAKDWQPYRITGVSEHHSGESGGSLSFTYAHNRTTITDHNNNKKTIQFNDFGNPVSIQDDEGNAQHAQFAKNTDADTGTKNQLLASSKLQNTVVNLIRNSGFEQSSSATSWSLNASGATLSRTTEQAYTGEASLRLDYSNVSGDVYATGPVFQAQPGVTYTFSAYVKTSGMDVSMGLMNTANWHTTFGEGVSSNTDWTRIQMHYTNTTGGAVSLRPVFCSSTRGVFYVDCVQVEAFPTASRYNLIENGDFSDSGSPAYQWTGSGLTASDMRYSDSRTATPHTDSNLFTITGEPTKEKHLSYTVNQSGSEGDCYVFSGWAWADNAVAEHNYQDENNPREFNITLTLHYTDGEAGEFVAKFNPSSNTWQYTAAAAVAEKAYSAITFTIRYDHNANEVWFDGMGLFKEAFGSSYTYDEDGNVISVTDLQRKTTTYEYDENDNVTKIIQDNKAKMTYEYDNYHNVTKATSAEGLVYTFQYDQYGNNTVVSAVGENGEEISAWASYSDDGNYLEEILDPLNRVTKYSYDADTGVLNWVQMPGDTEDSRTEYTYDSLYRMVNAAMDVNDDITMSSSYVYSGSYLTTLRTPDTDYNFTYGDFGVCTEFSVGNWYLARYTYDPQDHLLTGVAYHNGDSVQYTYDQKGRPVQERYVDGSSNISTDTVTYAYDNSGNLATVSDSATGRTTTYYYDLTDRLMQYAQTGSGYSHKVTYSYDALNNLSGVTEDIDGRKATTAYSYDDDNRVTAVSTGNVSQHYSYDVYGRVTQKQTKNGSTVVKTESYTYQDLRAGEYTSAQVKSHSVTVGGNTTVNTYSYDQNGNITDIVTKVNGTQTNTVRYTYDKANQLTREDDQAAGTTKTWSYDKSGNVTSCKTYAYTTESVGACTDDAVFTYTDTQWGDWLNTYRENEIENDYLGNLQDEGNGWTYTWKHGRQLHSLSDGTDTWTYTYDANGMRTGRSNDDTTYTYVYNGSQLTRMTKDSANLYFTYDADGTPLTVTLNGTLYYYVTNLQGDVVAITNAAGEKVVTYTYSAWGAPLSCTGSEQYYLGRLNPLRYRGYVYDQECYLYYLQSRYYSYTYFRFVSPDAFASTGQGFTGNNMFAYCGNNPVNRVDPTGMRHDMHGGYAIYNDTDYKAYLLIRETDIIIDYSDNEIEAKVLIQNNPTALYLQDPNVAIAYAHKLNKRISTIAEDQNTTLQVMSVEHIYSELLAHYYVYIGLNTIPGCQGLPILGAYYEKASEATLNPTENRKKVLFLMDQIQKHIGGRYDEGD